MNHSTSVSRGGDRNRLFVPLELISGQKQDGCALLSRARPPSDIDSVAKATTCTVDNKRRSVVCGSFRMAPLYIHTRGTTSSVTLNPALSTGDTLLFM